MCAEITDYKKLIWRDNYPCKDCAERYPACQDKCERMVAAKKAAEERKAIEQRNRYLQNDVAEYQIKQRHTIQHKKLKAR